MDRLNLYEKMYYSEYERKEKQNGKLSIILTIFSIITALLSYNISCYKKISNLDSIHVVIILHLIIFSAIMYVVALYFTTRTFIGYTYAYTPSAKTIDETYLNQKQYFEAFHEKNKDYYEERGISVDDLVDNQMNVIMSEWYRDMASHNFYQNNIKTKFLSFSMYCLGAVVVLSLICSLYFEILAI